ncbi:hypothetical protein HLB15_04535 [Promicromonospora citrea]|uniref:hypothetical protein n=1 Tax=Promicromonospora citrea TaxID=43677 RepID=UPI001489A5D4|nr:hypothetical protein [Promicromonospora citrea]NNH51533.1 hypothetical protein [Promicromonospora citrea]
MTLSAYLDLTVAQAEQQWREIVTRPDLTSGPASGQGRVNHLPVETLLAGAVRLVANVRAGGGDRKFPSPVPELARLFRRKPNAVATACGPPSCAPGTSSRGVTRRTASAPTSPTASRPVPRTTPPSTPG